MPRVNIGEIWMNFEQAGEGTPLLLLHGLGNDLGIWDADAEALAAYHLVVRPDLRGFGQSDKPPGPYSPEMLAADVERLLVAAGVGCAHVAGISMGGVIAQRLALDFPERVRSLTLVSTSSEVGERGAATWRRLADLIEKRGFDAGSADASRAFSPGFVERHPEVVAALGRRNAANDPRSYAAAARAVSDYRWTEQLARIDVPVLILQGLDDRLTPPGGSVKMKRALRRARLLMIPGVGHNLPLEQPDLFRAALLAFTGGVDLADADRQTPGASFSAPD
jgi:pimeloyl-ACP methyl ester carboxylesterase